MEYRIGRLRGGFAVTWTEDGRRRRYRLEARDPKSAEAEALRVIRREVAAGPTLTVGRIWDLYVEDRAGRRIAHTMRYMRRTRDAFAALTPDQITARQCRDYAAARRADGLGDGSIWTELGNLQIALNWAVKTGLCKTRVHIERPSKPAPRERWLDHDEIRTLLDSATTPHIRLAAILMLTTAGRVGAVLDLTWDRVDFARAEIDLRIDATGPRKGRARVPMNALARKALLEARRAALTDHVIEWNGRPVRSITKGFAAAVRASGLEGVSPHVLRHTAGVHMAVAGVPMSKISQFMGHSNVAVTERVYARFAPGHMAEAAAALDFQGSLNRGEDSFPGSRETKVRPFQ